MWESFCADSKQCDVIPWLTKGTIDITHDLAKAAAVPLVSRHDSSHLSRQKPASEAMSSILYPTGSNGHEKFWRANRKAPSNRAATVLLTRLR